MRKRRTRYCINCGTGSGWVHPPVYLCLCSECWRPALIAGAVALLVGWLLP